MTTIAAPLPAASPVLLAPDNFTPASRTPWGGASIVERYKRFLAGPGAPALVGESWELSVEPDFPSKIDNIDRTSLADVIARDPSAWLGAEHRRLGRTSTALLVKLLDARDDLSVQIHPSDEYRGLGASEAGKPESWYILDREPGAGIYFGLRRGVTREALEQALRSGGDVGALLAFVPVERGDFFVIDAGTVHAIGRGLTLVEPQHVAPGKRGLTYRFFDWNRRYDASGTLSDRGSPRALHIDDALAVTHFDAPREEAFLAVRRKRAGAVDVNASPRIDALAGGEGGLDSSHLVVSRLSGTGSYRLPPSDTLRALTVVAGTVTVRTETAELTVEAGRTAALPACLAEVQLELAHAHAIFSAIAVA